MKEPIRVRFTVGCSQEHAFDLWAKRTSLWWPVDHTLSGQPGLIIRFDPQPGGRIYERTPDGVELDWGEVLAWQPPDRLAYVWRFGRAPSEATEVEVNFVGGEGSTTVTIVHRGWDRLGEAGPELRSRNDRGWRDLIPLYVEACAA